MGAMGPVLFALALGLAVGSFLNVLLTRVPRGESVVTPASHCRSCRRAIAWYDNLPVVSWLALRGRCRRCGARISIRYMLVELATGLAAAAAAALWLRVPALEGARG